MIGYGIDRGGPKDSENAPNSFLTKINEKGFWRFATDITICAIVLVNLFQLNTDIALAIVIDTLGDNIVFHMGHPGDEVLGLFGSMVYKNDKSFKIHPKTELTQVDLELKANQKDWNMDSSLKGLSLRILMSHKPDLWINLALATLKE